MNGLIDVTVTTPAGTSGPAPFDNFDYTGPASARQ